MKTIMKLNDLNSIDQVEDFLAGTQPIAFSLLEDKDARYAWIQVELVRFGYLMLSRSAKGVMVRYLTKITGYSRQQLTRLIKQYRVTGQLQRRQRTVAGFKTKYTEKDIRLLAKMDERHDTPCGPAIKKLCERACRVYGEADYAALACISISHLYNLRQSTTYARQRRYFEPTRSKPSSIDERRKPQANGQPGYIRIDTVHQGDEDGKKGVYHINAVDEITQFEVVCCVEKISERFLIPVLQQLLDAFPFIVRGFHSDNGSEYINKQVATLLDKLHIEFTKSRSRHSNDNALVEGKNAAIVRKHFGRSHIPQQWAAKLNAFSQRHLTPYINYHRPCFFAETKTDAKGKERKIYRYENMMTPYDKLKSLPDPQAYLKPGQSFEILDRIVQQTSDNQAAEQLQKARQKLFNKIHGQNLNTA